MDFEDLASLKIAVALAAAIASPMHLVPLAPMIAASLEIAVALAAAIASPMHLVPLAPMIAASLKIAVALVAIAPPRLRIRLFPLTRCDECFGFVPVGFV